MAKIDERHELYDLYGRPLERYGIQNESSEDLYEHSQQNIINGSFKNVPTFIDQPEARPEQISSSYGQIYKLDPAKSRRAIIDANYSCEADNDHESFIRKNSDNRYTE